MASSINQVQQQYSNQEFPFMRIIRLFIVVSFLAISWFLYHLIYIGQPSAKSEFYRLWIIAFGLGILLEIILLVLMVLMWTRFGEELSFGLRRFMI